MNKRTYNEKILGKGDIVRLINGKVVLLDTEPFPWYAGTVRANACYKFGPGWSDPYPVDITNAKLLNRNPFRLCSAEYDKYCQNDATISVIQ